MSFIFQRESSGLVFAKDYIRTCKHARSLPVPGLGLTFHELPDCLVVGKESQVIMPVRQKNLLPVIVKDSCPYLANEFTLAAFAEQSLALGLDPLDLDEAAAFYPPGATNLWHWLNESMPRILALEREGYKGLYLVPGGAHDVDNCLELFGIAKDRIVHNQGRPFRVKRLMVPPRLSGFQLAANMPLTRFLREKLLEATGTLPGTKRLYVKRIGRRRILNEADLLPVLQDFGFETLIPEEVTLKEEFLALSNAECSLMAHGANSALVLAQKSRSLFIELFSNRYVSYTSLHAVRLLGLQYHSLVQELEPADTPANGKEQCVYDYLYQGMTHDITVDPLHVRIILENALR